jgi:hypothetical protein
MIACSNCGAAGLSEVSRFCTKCGAALPAQQGKKPGLLRLVLDRATPILGTSAIRAYKFANDP